MFAFATFIGAAFAVGLGERSPSGMMVSAGMVLHLAESHAFEHEHVHEHEALEHEHAHRH